MKFNSQICTSRSQSERLLALGVKKETADMGIVKSTNEIYVGHPTDYSFENGLHIPAWSLHRLIELAEVSVEVSGIWVRISSAYRYEEKDNAYDNLVDAIADLINNDVFNKEYLEDRV